MKKEHKVFIILGIPIWILLIILLVFNWYPSILMSGLFLFLLILIFLGGKRDHRSIQFVKVGLIMLIIEGAGFLSLYEDPAVWGDQYKKNGDIELLITPDDEYVQLLKVKFETWLNTSPSISGKNFTKFSTFYDDGLIQNRIYSYMTKRFYNISWAELNDIERCMVIDWYVRNYIIEWTSDTTVYGLTEFKATPHEVLQQNVNNNWTSPALDDCDGEAVVTVSLMRLYGIESYIGDGRSHWFTVVKIPDDLMKNYSIENVIMLNFWQTVGLWSYFDEDEFHVGQSPFNTLLDIFYMDDDETFEMFYDFTDNYLWSLYPLSFLAAVIAVLFVGFPRHYSNQEEDENREKRRQKLHKKFPWSENRKNPITWILELTIVRTGNPFRKVYKNEWINVIFAFVLIIIPIQVMLAFATQLTMYTFIILNIYIFLAVYLLERDIIIKIKNFYTKKSEKKPLEAEEVSIPK
jgi:hypothetical protein